jgi:hypothetical protein
MKRVVATPLSFSLYVLLTIQDQGSCSVLGIISGIFSYLSSRNVTFTNDAIVVFNHGKAIRKTFSAAKALEIILAGSGSEDDEIDIDREIGTTMISYMIKENCQIRKTGLREGQKQREQSEAAMRELSQASVPETFEAVTNNNLQ